MPLGMSPILEKLVIAMSGWTGKTEQECFDALCANKWDITKAEQSMGIHNCDCCGIQKDITKLESNDRFEKCIPLVALEISPRHGHSNYKVANVCFKCFDNFDVDHWIDEDQWIASKPKIPFLKLKEYNNETRNGLSIENRTDSGTIQSDQT